MIDLANVLGAVAERATAAASPLPVDRLVGRLHRTRTVRTATYSAIGVGAAAVVTVGAIAANGLTADRDPDPAPPATDEPGPTADRTPRATPTPTPTPTPTEVAWEPRWDLCGTSMADLLALDDSESEYLGGWWLETPWRGAAFPLNESSMLTATLFPPDGSEEVSIRVTDTVITAVASESGSGVVVAVANRPYDATTQGLATDDEGLDLAAMEIGFTACTASPLAGGPGSLTEPLPEAAPGTYYAMVIAELTDADGTAVTTIDFAGYVGAMPDDVVPEEGPTIPDREPVSLTTDVALRLAVGHTLNNRTDTPQAMQTWCGATVPASTPWLSVTSTPGSPLTLSVTGFLENGELILQLTTTNTGTPITGASVLDPDITVVGADGLVLDPEGRFVGNDHVLGRARDVSREFVTPTWASGAQTRLEASAGPFTCTFMNGMEWPAGTYEVYASQTVVVPDQPGYPGGRRDVVVGGPFTFTLD